MPIVTLEQGNRWLAPGQTPEQLREQKKASLAVDLYRRELVSLDAAAEFADVPKACLLAMMSDDAAERQVSDAELGRDAQRYITVDAEILSGTPCLKGTRVPAHYIADMVANGDSASAILAAYPYLTEGQIHAAVAYARAFPEYDRARGRPPWRTHQPLVSSNTLLDDL